MAKRPNPETNDVKSGKLTAAELASLSAAGYGAAEAALARSRGVGVFAPSSPAIPPQGGGMDPFGHWEPTTPGRPAVNPTLGRAVGAPRAWNYVANLSDWKPTSKLGHVGKFGVGAGMAYATSLATDAAVDWVTKTGNTERVNALTKRLKEQGVDITKEEVSSILMQYADPMAASKVLGMDYNAYAGGVKAGSQIVGAIGGGTATSAGLGSYFQGLRNWIESGAYDERDNMVESIIKQRRDTNSRMKQRVAELGPAMAEGLYGPQYRKDMEMPTLGQVGFNAPRPDTEGMSPEELNARNNYLSTPVQERIWRKDAPLVGGEQFYKDVAEMFPSEQQVVDESNPDAPRILGPATQVPEGLRRQQIDEVMNFHNLAPEVKARVEGGKSADMIYSGQPTFTNPKLKGQVAPPVTSPTAEKKPLSGGQVEVTGTSSLPNPTLSPPSNPQEAINNIITAGVSRGLSPIAAEMENYINKQQGMKTAQQRDAEIAEALKDPNSAFSQAARRNYEGAQANRPYALVPEDQLKGRSQGDAYAMKLLLRGDITADQMPNNYGSQVVDRQLRGEMGMVNYNEKGYQAQAENTGFWDSRENAKAKGTDQLHDYFMSVAESNRLNRRQKLGITPTTQVPDLLRNTTFVTTPNGNVMSKGKGMDGWSWE